MTEHEHDPRTADNDKPDEKDRKAKIYTDDVKQRHTSHWDLDYMSTEEVDEAYAEGEKERDDDADE